MNSTRHWKIITLAAVLMAAFTLTMTPASSHVAGWAHNWKQHIKPKTDQRYYTKAASSKLFSHSKLAPGRTESGVFGAGAPDGNWAVTTIEFDSAVASSVTTVYASPTTANCPGVGQAAAGYLCLYPAWNYNMTYNHSLAMPGATDQGRVLYFMSSAAQGNVRGSWTVRAPLASTRVAPQPRQALPPSLG